MRPSDFQAVFEATANPYMLLDRELRYVAANRAYLEVTASRLEDILGRSLFDAFPNDPADPGNRPAQILRSSLEKVLRTRQRDFIAVIRYRVARVPGGPLEERLWSATHTPILDEHGEVAYILQHTTDVTELRRLQTVARTLGVDVSHPNGSVEAEVLRRAREVQESRDALDFELQRVRQMFDQAPGFFAFMRGPDHVFEMINGAYERLIGRGGVVGKPVREALPEIAGQGFYELLDRVYATREPYVGRAVPVTLARAEGGGHEDVILDFVYQPIVGSDGRTVGILVQGNDVTLRVRIETQQRFLARASEVLASARDGLDAALRQLATVAVDGFADWCIIDLFDEEGRARRLARARRGSDELADEAERYPPAGEVSPAHPTLRADAMEPVVHHFDGDAASALGRSLEHARWLAAVAPRSVLGVPLVARGRRLGVLTFLLTTTNRRFGRRDRAVGEELARMASTVIDNSILSRERNELYLRAEAARERAEAANQAKDEFLAMLGHELRNPLSPILTAVQLLRLRGAGDAARELTIIERQAEHLVRLVDDLLDVSRIARGKVALHKQPTDIAGVVANAVEIASPLFERKQHRLSVDVAREPLVVDGDAVRLSQVVANLLTNAARYTEQGGNVWLSARAEAGEVVVRVRDDGVGIAAELLPRIFDMFVQGARRNDRPEGGLGLGLTLVRSLVALHGGRVEARSDGLGRGSEFIVRLPRVAAAAVAATTPAAPPPTGKPTAAAAPRRVLIVDDNVDAAQLLAEVLELSGYQTALAHDGPTALTAALRFAPDIALLDIGLPVMDGYELAAHLRSALGPAAPRIVALTGYGQKHDRERSRAAGFDSHLVKPVDAETLLRALQP